MKSITIGNWIDAYVVALCMTTTVLLFTAVSTNAHAYLAESIPRNGELLSQSPAQIVAYFTEELDSNSSMAVLDENGRQVDNGDGGVDLFDPDHKSMIATLSAGLPAGQYTVEWKALSSEDGDPTDGTFVFTVGEPKLAANNAVNNAATFDTSQPNDSSIGWWIGGGIGALIVGLLVIMLLLTRQPTKRLE